MNITKKQSAIIGAVLGAALVLSVNAGISGYRKTIDRAFLEGVSFGRSNPSSSLPDAYSARLGARWHLAR